MRDDNNAWEITTPVGKTNVLQAGERLINLLINELIMN